MESTARYKSTGTVTARSSTGGSDTGRYKSAAGSSTVGHTDVLWVMTRLSPPVHDQHTLESVRDLWAMTAITPRWQVHVVYRDRSPPDRSGDGSKRSSETRENDLRRELSQRLDSHISAIRDLVGQRLEEKLSRFMSLMETYVRQMAELSGYAKSSPVGETDTDSSSSSSSHKKRSKQRKK